MAAFNDDMATDAEMQAALSLTELHCRSAAHGGQKGKHLTAASGAKLNGHLAAPPVGHASPTQKSPAHSSLSTRSQHSEGAVESCKVSTRSDEPHSNLEGSDGHSQTTATAERVNGDTRGQSAYTAGTKRLKTGSLCMDARSAIQAHPSNPHSHLLHTDPMTALVDVASGLAAASDERTQPVSTSSDASRSRTESDGLRLATIDPVVGIVVQGGVREQGLVGVRPLGLPDLGHVIGHPVYPGPAGMLSMPPFPMPFFPTPADFTIRTALPVPQSVPAAACHGMDPASLDIVDGVVCGDVAQPPCSSHYDHGAQY